MRKVMLAAVFGAMALLLSAQIPQAKGPAGADVTCWQYGAPTTRIVAGDPFEIRGTGLRSSLPVVVCFSGEYCLHSDVDRAGSFFQIRSQPAAAGTYTMEVKQARNRKMADWMVRSSQTVTLAN